MLYDTDSADLIDFARRWANLGDAIADQVVQILDDPRGAAGHLADQADAPSSRQGQGVNDEPHAAPESGTDASATGCVWRVGWLVWRQHRLRWPHWPWPGAGRR